MGRVKDDQGRSATGRAVAMGFELASGVGLFTFIGFWVDRRRGTAPFWTLAGAAVGLLYVAYAIWKLLRWLDAECRAAAARRAAPAGPPGRGHPS